MTELEKILKALANRRRLAIIKYLKQAKEATVSDIAHEIRLSVRSTSKHLLILQAAHIVDREQKSLMVFYRLSLKQPTAARAIVTLV